MSDEPKTITISSNTEARVMVDLDTIRKSTGIGCGNGSDALAAAVARTLLAEIDRLSARVEALEHGVYPMEERVRSLEIDAAWKEGRQ